MVNLQRMIKDKSRLLPGMPLVMGVLNVTPDSFSDGGMFSCPEAIHQQVKQMIADGVDIIDVGGESTRPGAAKVLLEEELSRVIPVIELIRSHYDIIISIDTYKTEVMAAALEAGADMINDVNALQAEGAVALVASKGVPVCLMHKQGDYATMQDEPVYSDVYKEVSEFLFARAECCELAGVAPCNIVLDPGFGFGKTFEHNVTLFKKIDLLSASKYVILSGVSRKRMISTMLGEVSVSDRLVGSVLAAVESVHKGASIVRVHDVKETVQALTVSLFLRR